MSETLNTIRTVLAEVSNIDVSDVSSETDFTRDLDLDSVVFVQFLLALEDQLPGLEFNQEILSELAFSTVGSLEAHLDCFQPVPAQ